MIRIVHLSDLHYNGNCRKDFDEFILKALIKDLKKFNEEKAIDLIIISGDLIDKGGDGFESDIQLALMTFEDSFIAALKGELGLTNNQVFFVPGNHEVDQKGIKSYVEKGLKTEMLSTEVVNKYYDEKEPEAVARVRSYKEFERVFHGDYPNEHNITDYQSTFKLKIGEVIAGINCFNSSWRCYDSKTDRKSLIIGERQFTEAREIIGDCDLRIGIMHHPIDWMIDFDCKCCNNFIKDYQLVFCGHVHEGSAWVKTDMYGSTFISTAPSNWTHDIRSSNRIFANGYSIVDYDTASHKIEISNRRYSYIKESYDPNTDLGDDRGQCSFFLKNKEEETRYKIKTNLVKKLEVIHIDDKNEHLLSFFTDSKAPKEIEDIFVLPRIVNKIEYDIEKKKHEKHYTLEDLCNRNDSYLVFGVKESGKTILLDRLFIEFTKKVDKYDKIPVYIDFEEFSNSRFETAISHFLGVSIREVNRLIKEEKFVLLIDNLSFNKRNESKINKLEELVKSSKSLQLIATVTYTIEGEIPIELLEYDFFANLESVIIKCFKTKEIRELMHKWFINNKCYDEPEKLERLVKVFLTYNLPSTPLAVSMFLWIIEQQENYQPVNNAAMLENFIERVFKKHIKNEVLSEDFDFTNKQRLLANIAFEMYTMNLDNYRMPYAQLREYIYNYLVGRKFDDFNEEDLLKELLQKGILVKESAESTLYVRFRFTCFLQFFLMRKMQFDESFKKFVLEEENFMQFVDEIDYYTALERGQTELLQLIVERMSKEYSELIEKIEKFPLSYDTIFETETAMANKLDKSFVSGIKSAGKPSENELDEIKDSLLDNTKSQKGIEKKVKVGNLERLAKIWILAAKILKNTEETDVENLKANCYKLILKSSMAFANLYKHSLNKYIKSLHQKEQEVNEQYLISDRLLPLIHQILLYTNVGTGKLKSVIREKIESDLKNEEIPELEKFMSVFIYADLHGKDYIDYIKQFAKDIDCNYMYDMTLLKLVSYYFLRSKSKATDNIYENLIAELIVNAKGEKKSKKGKIIQEYRTKRIITTKLLPASHD